MGFIMNKKLNLIIAVSVMGVNASALRYIPQDQDFQCPAPNLNFVDSCSYEAQQNKENADYCFWLMRDKELNDAQERGDFEKVKTLMETNEELKKHERVSANSHRQKCAEQRQRQREEERRQSDNRRYNYNYNYNYR